VPPVPRADHHNPPPELVRLGHALRALREGRGLKQIEVASGAGVTESQVSDLERARNDARWTTIARIVEGGLGLTLADLAAAYAEAPVDGQGS